MKHTPGPWVIRSKGNQEWAIDAPGGDKEISFAKWDELATCYGNDDEPIKGAIIGRANAYLIAAAPEMKVALGIALVALATHNEPEADRIIRAAIAKAEGRA